MPDNKSDILNNDILQPDTQKTDSYESAKQEVDLFESNGDLSYDLADMSVLEPEPDENNEESRVDIEEKRSKTSNGNRKKPVKVFLALLLILILSACAIGGYLYYKQIQLEKEMKRQEALELTKNNLSISFLNEAEVNSKLNGTILKKNDAGGTIEYANTVIYPEDLIRTHTGELDITGDIPINASKLGEYKLSFNLHDTTEYGDEVSIEIVKSYTVVDTAFPQIVLSENSVTLTEGDDYDCADNIVSVTDPVDGELGYEISGDLDLDEPGTYSINIVSYDRNGNRSEAEFTVVVEEKYVAPSNGGGGSSSSDYSLPYAVYVNCAANTVTIYSRDSDGEYTVPVKAMVCSTGSGTPRGTYYTYDDPSNSVWSPYYPWWPLYGGVYGMYAYGIVGDILFHSVPYYSPDPGDLEWEEYNKLGTSASMGCVRLAVSDVLWIFNNCPHGTMVVFYDDASYPGPLGKPSSIYIDPSSPNRGWDPTDPDPNNPWNS